MGGNPNCIVLLGPCAEAVKQPLLTSHFTLVWYTREVSGSQRVSVLECGERPPVTQLSEATSVTADVQPHHSRVARRFCQVLAQVGAPECAREAAFKPAHQEK